MKRSRVIENIPEAHARAAALAADGYSIPRAAKEMNVTVSALTAALYRAVQSGLDIVRFAERPARGTSTAEPNVARVRTMRAGRSRTPYSRVTIPPPVMRQWGVVEPDDIAFAVEDGRLVGTRLRGETEEVAA